VHELTHFLQMKSTVHPGLVTCRIWNEREREAYEVQTRWLRDTSVSVHVFSVEMARLNLRGMHPMCMDTSDSAPQKSWTKG